MEQRDYVQRQIEQLGRVLGKIFSDLLGLKSQGKVSNGMEITSQVLKDELDIDIKNLTDLPIEEFISKLKSDKSFSNENLEKLANLFSFIADNSTNNILKKLLYEKSLAVLTHLEDIERIYSFERQSKIERLKQITRI
jgi:hypothetical protein